MQLQTFKIFISDIIVEAERLQRHDIAGKLLTSKKYTDSQKISFGISIFLLLILKNGFTDNFAAYSITFLGIFIGLFTTIVISLYERKELLFEAYQKNNQIDNSRLKKVRNYFIQFTGLISYSILIALFTTILLLLVLLFPETQENLWKYHFIKSIGELQLISLWIFLRNSLLILQRFVTVYLLCRFFLITLYAISSYFSFLISEYKRVKLKTRKDEEIIE